MPTNLIPNSFTSYDLSDEEVIQGSIFNLLQSQVLHNLRSVYAEEKLALEYDPEHTEQFTKAYSRLEGILEVLDYVLENSDAIQFQLANPTQTTEE